MEDFRGKVAVVTGAASGIGRGLAERFADEGMRVVLADIEADPLQATAAALTARGAEVRAVTCDVSDQDQVLDLATLTYEQFGTAHVVCNNAGVGGGSGPSWEIPQNAWDWTFGVNFWGVLHGIRAFVPRLVAQQQGHVVNTASLAGLTTIPFMSPYAATKHAVVGLSEALAIELAMIGSPVRVSVLCPGFIRTRIHESERNWPARLGDPPPGLGNDLLAASVRATIEAGMDPADLAARVVAAIRDERFFILSDDEHAVLAQQRADDVRTGRQPRLAPPEAFGVPSSPSAGS